MPNPSPPADQRRHPLPGVELVDTDVRVRFDGGVLRQKTGGRGRARAATTKKGTGLRKVPVAGAVGAKSNLYREILDGVEPCLSPPAAAGDVTGLAFLSLNISWPPEHHLRQGGYYWVSYIQSRDKSCLLSLLSRIGTGGSLSIASFLVYDTLADSVAIVPSPSPTSTYLDLDAPCGLTILSFGCGGRNDYVLAQLSLHVNPQSRLPTNNGTLLMWRGSLGGSGGSDHDRWIEKERDVLLPLPLDQCPLTGIPCCFFCADMAFAVGSLALCWADLVTGLLIYRIHEQTFHFIPLPKDCVTERYPDNIGKRQRPVAPNEYRSMCCIQRQGGGQVLRLVSMEGYSRDDVPISEVTLTTWSLVHPLHPDDWAWNKDEACFRLGDLYDHPVYKDELKLEKVLVPCYPLISSVVKTRVIYLSFIDVECNHEQHTGELRGIHVLSVDMDSRSVHVSAFKGPSSEFSELIPFACNFGPYKNKFQHRGKIDTIVAIRKSGYSMKRFSLKHLSMKRPLVSAHLRERILQECPKGKEVADEGDLYEEWSSSEEECPKGKEVADEGDLYEEWSSSEEGDALYEWSIGKEVFDEGKWRNHVKRMSEIIRATGRKLLRGESSNGLQSVLDYAGCTVLRGESSKIGLQSVLDYSGCTVLRGESSKISLQSVLD